MSHLVAPINPFHTLQGPPPSNNCLYSLFWNSQYSESLNMFPGFCLMSCFLQCNSHVSILSAEFPKLITGISAWLADYDIQFPFSAWSADYDNPIPVFCLIWLTKPLWILNTYLFINHLLIFKDIYLKIPLFRSMFVNAWDPVCKLDWTKILMFTEATVSNDNSVYLFIYHQAQQLCSLITGIFTNITTSIKQQNWFFFLFLPTLYYVIKTFYTYICCP